MPTSSFVNSCISSPSNKIETDYLYFTFGLEVGQNRSTFSVYKDLKGIDSTKKHLLSLNPLNKVVDINRSSNDSYYNFVLNAFKIPMDKEIKCFIHKIWRPNFAIYQDTYYFCFDDFPIQNKGYVTVSTKSHDSFIGKLFKDSSWGGNKYITGSVDLYSFYVYDSRFGSTPTCSSSKVESIPYYSNNRGCLSLPISVSYSIHNYEDPMFAFLYETGFTNSYIITSLIYYLKLGDISLSDGTCCLAQCFGITE